MRNKKVILFILFLVGAIFKAQLCNTQLSMTHQEGKNMFYSIQLLFGVKGPKPRIWDGRASINEGKLVGISAIGFDEEDGIFQEEGRWRCAIQRAKGLGRELSIEGTQEAHEIVEEILGKGVVLDFQAPKASIVTIETAAGVFSFSLEDLVLGQMLTRLQGNLEISLAPKMINIGSPDYEDYYPSIAIDSLGNIWATWISFQSGRENIIYRYFNGKDWSVIKPLVSKNTHYFRPELAADNNGRVWAVWGQLDGDNWHLYARMWNGNKWKSAQRITKGNSPNSDPSLTLDESGRLWVVWQCHIDGRLDIAMKSFDPEKNKWSDIILVTSSYENDRQPSVATDRNGNIFIAWETYKDARHQIMLTRYAEGKFNEKILLRSSKWRVSHTDLMVDNADRLWIAWDEGGKTWGYGKLGSLEGFYGSKTFKLLCYDKGNLLQTITKPHENFSAPLKKHADLPKLFCDQNGRIWVLFFHFVNKKPVEIWCLQGVFYEKDNWSYPISFPQYTQRSIKPAEAAIDVDGHLWAIWSSDSRQIKRREMEDRNIFIGNICLMGDSPKGISLKPAVLELDLATKEEILIKEAKIMKQRYISQSGNKEYELIWGYYFKQHDLRGKMGIDDFIYDVYCYTRDDQDLDFFAIKDYGFRREDWYSDDNFFHWMSKKILSLFACSDYFFTFFEKGKSPYIFPPGHVIIRKVAPPGVHVMTGIYVEGKINEKNIAEAVKLRHFYEATDKIVVDLNTNGHIMGSQYYTDDARAKTTVKILGTANVTKVNILRNKICMYSAAPNKNNIEFTYVDMKMPEEVLATEGGGMHYLVDFIQEDGGMGWTMPTCIHYRPDGIDY